MSDVPTDRGSGLAYVTPPWDRAEARGSWYQCPGCWSMLLHPKPRDGWVECECGERMTLVDLRERVEQPLNEDTH